MLDRLQQQGGRRGDVLLVIGDFNDAGLAALFCDFNHQVVVYRVDNRTPSIACIYSGGLRPPAPRPMTARVVA